MKGCVYRREDGLCDLFTDEIYTSWCDYDHCACPSPSNGDTIRTMSDEELAEFLSCGGGCPEGYNEIGACEPEKEACINCWLKWLREKAEEKE